MDCEDIIEGFGEEVAALLARLKSAFQTPFWRHVSKFFAIPQFHRFEIIFMRVLYAYVLFQCM